MLILGVVMWIITAIGVVGISDEELNARPITGWRRKLRFAGDDLGRFICFCMGLSVTKVGSKVIPDKMIRFLVTFGFNIKNNLNETIFY